MADALVVMARKPVPGTVKTRLAREVGDVAACDLHRAFLLDLHARLSGRAWSVLWAVHPPASELGADLGRAVEEVDQRGRDLAERMKNCFDDVFGSARWSRVVMIGADAPHLAPEQIEEAFVALEENDVVAAPTRDGGYALIGLRHPHDLFTGIPMGTHEVWSRTADRIRRLGLRVAVLAETLDIDEIGDLAELAAMIRRGEASLPNTAAVLASLGLA